MPRIDGVSARSTVWLMRRSPIPSTIRACLRSNPIVLLTSVTLTRFVSADFFAAFFAISLRSWSRAPRPAPDRDLLDCCHLFEVLAAQAGDGRRRFEALEPVEGRAHDIVRVGGTERLGQHIVQSRRLDHRAHGTACDDT